MSELRQTRLGLILRSSAVPNRSGGSAQRGAASALTASSRLAPVGDFWGITTYGDAVAAIQQTDNAVTSLDVDITANQAKLPAGFFDAWAAWKGKWVAWRDDHTGQFAGAFWSSPASVMEERNGWQTELFAWSQQYESVTKLKASGPPVQKPPEPGPDLTKTIGESVDTFAKTVRYALLAVVGIGVVAGAYVIYKEAQAHVPAGKRHV